MAQTDPLSLIFPVDFTLFVNKTIKWKVLWTGYDHCGLTGIGPALAPNPQRLGERGREKWNIIRVGII